MNKNTKSVKKITKLSELDQTDGRMIDKDVASTKLEVLLGADGMGKYGTLDKEEYLKKINSFNTAELRNHSIHAGLIPISDVNRLKKQLLIEFEKYALAFTAPTKFRTSVLSKDKQKVGLDIMSAVK